MTETTKTLRELQDEIERDNQQIKEMFAVIDEQRAKIARLEVERSRARANFDTALEMKVDLQAEIARLINANQEGRKGEAELRAEWLQQQAEIARLTARIALADELREAAHDLVRAIINPPSGLLIHQETPKLQEKIAAYNATATATTAPDEAPMRDEIAQLRAERDAYYNQCFSLEDKNARLTARGGALYRAVREGFNNLGDHEIYVSTTLAKAMSAYEDISTVTTAPEGNIYECVRGSYEYSATRQDVDGAHDGRYERGVASDGGTDRPQSIMGPETGDIHGTLRPRGEQATSGSNTGSNRNRSLRVGCSPRPEASSVATATATTAPDAASEDAPMGGRCGCGAMCDGSCQEAEDAMFRRLAGDPYIAPSPTPDAPHAASEVEDEDPTDRLIWAARRWYYNCKKRPMYSRDADLFDAVEAFNEITPDMSPEADKAAELRELEANRTPTPDAPRDHEPSNEFAPFRRLDLLDAQVREQAERLDAQEALVSSLWVNGIPGEPSPTALTARLDEQAKNISWLAGKLERLAALEAPRTPVVPTVTDAMVEAGLESLARGLRPQREIAKSIIAAALKAAGEGAKS